MRKIKKITGILLALSILFAFLPVMAFAGSESDEHSMFAETEAVAVAQLPLDIIEVAEPQGCCRVILSEESMV